MYASNNTDMTYVLSTYNSTFADANMDCKLQVCAATRTCLSWEDWPALPAAAAGGARTLPAPPAADPPGGTPACHQGGSLATFRSLAVQQEIESYYIDQGLLLPVYHRVSGWPGSWGACWRRSPEQATLDVLGSAGAAHS
jgi:hypothetical protein